MVENNYDILGILEDSTVKEIRDGFRRLALQFHSDKGGDIEKFIKIKEAYEDLKIGKKYPDTDVEKLRKSRVYTGDSEENIRRKNQILYSLLTLERSDKEVLSISLSCLIMMMLSIHVTM